MQYFLMSDSFLVDDLSKCRTPKNYGRKSCWYFYQIFAYFDLVCCMINRQQCDSQGTWSVISCPVKLVDSIFLFRNLNQCNGNECSDCKKKYRFFWASSTACSYLHGIDLIWCTSDISVVFSCTTGTKDCRTQYQWFSE